RKTMVTSGKRGILEVIDRTNGQWLWHKEMVPQNVVASIDPKSGAKTINAAIVPKIGQPATTCPANPGARGWPATAYNPRTGILYMPINEFCATMTATALNPGQAYSGDRPATFKYMAMP